MNDPRRLKDDPDSTDLGRALRDEPMVVGNYDLQRLRARVVGGSPVPASPSWWKIAAVSGATAAIVTFAILKLQSPPQAPIAPPSTPRIEVLDPSDAEGAPRTTEPSADDDAVAAIEPSRPSDPVVPPARSGSDADAPVEPAPPAVDEGTAEAPAPEAPTSATPSALVAELADYNVGVELDAAGRWMDAHAAWSQYLARWPSGRLRTEARLGMLRALVNADRPGDVERLAGELLATPDLGAHRDDLRLIRAEALVKLDRCSEAVALLESARRSPRVSAVRSTCRKAATP